MPTERLSMRHIREVLRLHHSVGMSQRAVARSLDLAQGTVSKYLNRARRAGLTWPLPPELDAIDRHRLESAAQYCATVSCRHRRGGEKAAPGSTQPLVL